MMQPSLVHRRRRGATLSSFFSSSNNNNNNHHHVIINCAIAIAVLSVLIAFASAQGGCGTYCANNNQCTTASCTYCRAGVCSAGLPCSSLCVVDTDCDQTGSCTLCTFGLCSPNGGGGPPPPPPYPYNATKACSLNAGAQLCGPPNTVVVEHNWKSETCFGLSNDMDYRGYFSLGCVNNNSLVLGSSTTHSPPTPDCGWSSGASNARYPFNKACTAVYNSGTCSGIWDTVVVGFGWSPSTCESFSRAYNGYAGSRLACTFDYFQGGYSIGSGTGDIPSNDCGWAQSAATTASATATTTSTTTTTTTTTKSGRIPIVVTTDQHQSQSQSSSSTRTAINDPGSKICVSYDRTQAFRSTVNVNPLWQLGDCYNWVQQVNGDTAIMQVGCIFNTTYSLGALGGGKPNPNCGW